MIKAVAIHAVYRIYGVITKIFMTICRRIAVFASASFLFVFSVYLHFGFRSNSGLIA